MPFSHLLPRLPPLPGTQALAESILTDFTVFLLFFSPFKKGHFLSYFKHIMQTCLDDGAVFWNGSTLLQSYSYTLTQWNVWALLAFLSVLSTMLHSPLFLKFHICFILSFLQRKASLCNTDKERRVWMNAVCDISLFSKTIEPQYTHTHTLCDSNVYSVKA